MFDFIAGLLSWLYDLWPSYGGSIILLTLVIMTVMAPVTIRQTRSMIAMQQLGPELKRLKVKHGDDRERLNQEMMALYQANGVNPLGGCLPILIQMPIFLVLFQVVRGLTRRVSDIGLAVGGATYRADGAGADFAERTFNPDFLDSGSRLAGDLRGTSKMSSLGLDLSQSASGALGDSVITGLPYLLLVIGVGATTWLQQKQIQGRQGSAEINPQQQMIMKVLPFMLPVFSFGFPAALVVYWFVSNLFRVGQQLFITKKVYGNKDEDYEIIRPPAVEQNKDNGNQTARQKSSAAKGRGRGRGGGKKAGGQKAHGSRNPISTAAPKKAKRRSEQPKAAPKRSKPEARERQVGRTSKRVTPKKNVAPEPRSRRRDKKKKN